MKSRHFFYVACMAIAGLALTTSCSDDDDDNGVKVASVTLQFTAPSELQEYNPMIGLQDLVLTNVNTGETTTVIKSGSTRAASIESTNLDIAVTVPEGLYTISMEGTLRYQLSDEVINTKMRAYKESVTLTEAAAAVPVNVEGYVYNSSSEGNGNFVIAEIFFTGTTTPEGKQYTGDKYFRIYNNSGDTLCADGLAIAESAFMTVSKYDYTPDIMKDTFATQAIYRIPLGGNIMVNPGESLLLVDIGMDHTAANANSFDLSSADFEWYDESSNPNFVDTQTDVPDLEKIYCYTATIWGPHNRGFTAFALARLGDDEDNQLTKDEYLENYYYPYEYNMIFGGTAYPMSGDAYKIPNKWILDAVNLSVESEYVWNVTSPALDRGWTYCGKVNSDQTRYGKSVRRKVLSGKTLQDTNDSSVDFLPEQTADPFYKFHD